MKYLNHTLISLSIAFLLIGCGEKEKEVPKVKSYNPALALSEFKNGNKTPFNEIHADCKKEVATDAPRKIACAAYNEVLTLRMQEPIDHDAMHRLYQQDKRKLIHAR